MKIMTFNIQHALNYLEQKIDFPLFIRTINEVSPDICGLNEVRGRGERKEYTAQAEKIAAGCGMHSVFGPSVVFEGTSPYGNAVISKLAAFEMRVIPIEQTVERAEPRSVLRVDFGNIVILQTHLGLKEPELYKGCETIHTLLKAESKPCVLMGDFNLRPDHPAIQCLLSDPDINHADTGYTFPSDKPDRKIDYIFTNSKVKILDCYVPELIVSDHRPIIAEIEL